MRLGLLGRVGELDAAGLHAAAGEHLRLDHDRAADPPRDRLPPSALVPVRRRRPGCRRSRISRDSYSNNLTPGRHPVGLGQLGVLLGQHLGEVDHHLALLPGGVVLHLAVDHVHAAAVGDRLDHLLGERDLVRIGREDLLGDRDLHRVQRPGADAAEQERGAELGLAALDVLDVAVGAVERQRADRRAGVDHARDRVVPRVLLVAGARRVGVVRVGVGDRAVAGVAAADARRLHPPRGGQVGRAEAHALDARARRPRSPRGSPRRARSRGSRGSGSGAPGPAFASSWASRRST